MLYTVTLADVLSGRITSRELRATGGCQWQVVVHCGVLNERLLFSSGCLATNDDDDDDYTVYRIVYWNEI